MLQGFGRAWIEFLRGATGSSFQDICDFAESLGVYELSCGGVPNDESQLLNDLIMIGVRVRTWAQS